MTPPVPEAIVIVTKVVRRKRAKKIELHLGKVLSVKHENHRKEHPRAYRDQGLCLKLVLSYFARMGRNITIIILLR